MVDPLFDQQPETLSQGALPKVPDIVGSYYRYTFIDHGAQFRVYKVSSLDGVPTGRVVRVPLDYEETRLALEPHLRRLKLSDAEISRRIHELLIRKQELPSLLQGLLASDRRLMRLFGDIKIIPVLSAIPKHEPDYFMPLYFSQDYVTPMSLYLHRFRLAYLPPRRLQTPDIAAAKQLLHAIVKTHHTLWKYGIFEMGFKIENMGVRCKGKKIELVLLDMGEYTTDINEATKLIQEQRWLHSLNTNKTDHLFVPTVLHPLYVKVLNQAFTQEALHARWQTRIQRKQRIESWKLRFREMTAIGPDASISAWVKRQTLSTDLHRSIPESRIDQLSIPRDELNFLLMDRRVNQTPETVVNAMERAERHAFDDHIGNTFLQEMFRHTLPLESPPRQSLDT